MKRTRHIIYTFIPTIGSSMRFLKIINKTNRSLRIPCIPWPRSFFILIGVVVLCARCHLDALLVVRYDLLLTSPCVECCALVIRHGLFATSSFVEDWPLVPSFVNVIGVLPLLQASEFYHVCLMKASPKLLFIVVIVIFSYLVLIALLLPLLHGISPVYSTEHIPKYSSIENFMKLSFQRVVIRFKRSPNEGVMSRKFQSARPSMFWP